MGLKTLASTIVLALVVRFFASCATTIGAGPDASVGEMPNKGPVGRTMKANTLKYVACARDSVSVQTGTTQKIQLKFTVQPSGKVEKASIESMTAPDPDLHQCVLRVLRRTEFPKPGDAKPHLVTYPLVLKPE